MTNKTLDLLYYACYNCSSEDSTFYDSENGYTYVKCLKCGLIYLNPRPSNNEISKANEYGIHSGEIYFDITGAYNSKKVSKYLRILADFYHKEELQIEKQKWLDIGCGFGEFIEGLEKYSNSRLTIIGSEPNMKKVISCKKRNLTVDFLDMDQIHEKFNYISLLNVYSHIPNPIEFLSKLKESLAPNGEFLLETGHSCFLPAKFHHKPYYAPDHLSFASREIVENILERIGFKIIKTKIYRHPQFIHISSLKSLLYYSYEIISNKMHWKDLFPSYPRRDMFIRAKLISSK